MVLPRVGFLLAPRFSSRLRPRPLDRSPPVRPRLPARLGQRGVAAAPGSGVDQPGLRVPAGVGLGGQVLDLVLTPDLGVLLLEGGRGLAQVAQPLVPLGRGPNLAVVGGARVLDDAAPARAGRVPAADVLEFPVGVALEVKAWRGAGSQLVHGDMRAGSSRGGVWW